MKAFKIIGVFLCVLVLSIILYECGGQKAALTIDVTKPMTLRYKGVKGVAFNYNTELSLNHVYVSPEDNSEKMIDYIANYDYQLRYVDDEASGDMTYHLILGEYTLSRSVMNARPQVTPFIRLKGRRVSFSLSPTGAIKNRKELDVIRMEADMPVNPIDDVQWHFIKFPEQPVKKGDTWTKNFDVALTSLQLQGEAKVTDTYTFDGAEFKNDVECIKILIDRTYDYHGNINLPGLNYDIDGTAEEDLEFWFDIARGIIIAIERTGTEKIVSGVPEMPAAKVDQTLNTKLKFEIKE